MRATRISGQSQTIYRQNQRVPTVGDMAFQSSLRQQPHHHLREEKNQNQKRQQRKVKLTTNKHAIIVKGIHFSGEQSPSIHNDLLRNAQNLYYKTTLKVRNNKYQSSI